MDAKEPLTVPFFKAIIRTVQNLKAYESAWKVQEGICFPAREKRSSAGILLRRSKFLVSHRSFLFETAVEQNV